jgi:hypothetical protein
MALKNLEAEAKAFIHPRCWKYVRFIRRNPEPGRDGVLGWEYEKP